MRIVLIYAPASKMLAAADGYVPVGGFSGRGGLPGQPEGRYMSTMTTLTKQTYALRPDLCPRI